MCKIYIQLLAIVSMHRSTYRINPLCKHNTVDMIVCSHLVDMSAF